MLVLVAAGLVASALHSAHEAGWLNAGQGQALDLSWLVVPGSWTSALLTGMLGWQPQPTAGRADRLPRLPDPDAALRPLARARGPARAPRRAERRRPSTPLLLAVLGARRGCRGSCGSERRGDRSRRRQAVELKLTDAGCAPADAQARRRAARRSRSPTPARAASASSRSSSGARILGEKENLVAGLSGSFTLTLQPGHYTLSCPGGTTAATGVLTVGGAARRPRRPTRSCRPRSPATSRYVDAQAADAGHAGAGVRRRGQGG